MGKKSIFFFFTFSDSAFVTEVWTIL